MPPSASVDASDRQTFQQCPGLILDTETTGVSASDDRVVELGAICYRDGQPTLERRMRINPGRPIPAEATRVHGISDADVAGKPPFAAIIDRFLPYLDERMHDGMQPWLAGYNAVGFDIPLLNAELRRAGHPHVIEVDRVVDPMVFVRWHLRHLRSRSLESVCGHFGIPTGRAHSALDDARATGALLFQLITDGLIPNDIAAALQQQRVLTERLASEWQAFSYWLYHDRQDGSLRLGAGSMIGTLLTDASPDYLRSLLAKISDLPERVRDTFLSQAANAPARMPRRPPLRDSTGAGVSRG